MGAGRHGTPSPRAEGVEAEHVPTQGIILCVAYSGLRLSPFFLGAVYLLHSPGPRRELDDAGLLGPMEGCSTISICFLIICLSAILDGSLQMENHAVALPQVGELYVRS